MSFLQVPVDVVVGAVLTCPPEQVMLRVVPRNYLHNVAFESGCVHTIYWYGLFSHDITAAILVSQNNETAAMLVLQTSPVEVELFSYVNAFFCSNKFA